MSAKPATAGAGFWPRLFRRPSNNSQPSPSAAETQWSPQRPHANSSASAATAVADVVWPTSAEAKTTPPLSTTTPVDTQQQQTSPRRRPRWLQRRATKESRRPEQQPAALDMMHAESAGQKGAAETKGSPAGDRSDAPYSAGHLGISDGHMECLAFWRTHDRRLGQGGEQAETREILDAMVDDALTAGLKGWHVEPNQGTFNDALGPSALHPIVMTFARAHIEGQSVCLGPEHVWLAVLQSLAVVLRQQNAAKPVGDAVGANIRAGQRVDLEQLWRVLRDSSPVPRSSKANTGHEVRLFASEMHDRHALHSGHGATPLAMAAAAAGPSSSVAYGQIELGGRKVTWQATQRSTNPQWVDALARGPGVAGVELTGTLQTWSSLCVLVRQAKELYSRRYGSGVDWWLHRVHLLVRDLADCFAAQTEGGLGAAWRQWLSLALFDGHSGGRRGERLDGWLVALFVADASGKFIHSQQQWWMDWERLPSGVDLLHLSGINMYSGFVGVQQLRRRQRNQSTVRNHSRTLTGEDLEAALGMGRDGASTLAGSQENLDLHQLQDATQHDLHAAFASLSEHRAVAPLIGWALDG
ncbi:hypothetical protein H4R20_002392 [Coemansia guatemalensis]|uniref:Uncharacterized protein n=1 Tax=Coemansia guatemalensis TaxID=2761395 RepID=A0A9W8HV85_9FUNG|nr:hypothetical protein H4R20_002392 [Coemansia guatemalensis]